MLGLLAALAPTPASAARSATRGHTFGPFTVSNPVGVGCLGDDDPSCESISFSVTRRSIVEITTANADEQRADAEDHDITLVDDAGNEIGSSANTGSAESISTVVPPGTYTLVAQAFLVLPDSYLDATIVTTSTSGGDATPIDDDVLECLEAVPAAATPVLPGVGSEPIEITVALLIDGGISRSTARTLFDLVADSYEPMNIDLRIRSIKKIRLDGRGQRTVGESVRTTASAEDAIDAARVKSGGDRTATRADIVYVLTDKDIFVGGTGGDDVDDPGRNYGVVGLADCIGGVRFDHRSFAVSEVDPELETFGLFGTPVTMYHDVASDTIAHEIGHLMGAHHHYANCAEGIPSETPTDDGTIEASPCTLMTNFVDLTSVNFSTLSSGVVRGHAELRAAQRD